MLIHKLKICLAFLALVGVTQPHATAHAEDVYRYVSKSGEVYYSNKPRSPEDQPASLPQIQRENIQEKIADIKQSTPESCDNRGGIDCKAGADKDGSVVCADGYRDAELRFSLHCTKAVLKVDRFEVLDTAGNSVSLLEDEGSRSIDSTMSIGLTIRNNSKIDATGVDVSFYFPQIRRSFRAPGPSTIASYEVADYTLPLSVLSNATKNWAAFRARYKVYCDNCGASLGGANY